MRSWGAAAALGLNRGCAGGWGVGAGGMHVVCLVVAAEACGKADGGRK